MREDKVEEFINLKQGSMIVKEYSVKFVKLSRYVTSLISNIRNEMSRPLTGITGALEKKCGSSMLHDNMDLFRLMVHVQQVEESWKKSRIHDTRRPQPHDQEIPSNGGNRNNFGVREHPIFKKGQQSLGNSNFQRSTTLREGRTKPKKGSGGDIQRRGKNYAKCGSAHSGKCRHGTNAYFGFDKSGNMGAATAEPPKRNRFYAMKRREEQFKSADVVKCMLQVLSTFFYALLDPVSTLSFVTPLLSLTFEIFPDVLHDLIIVSTHLGENVTTDRVYKDCPIVVCGNTKYADLVKLPMHDFDVILGMDWLHSCYACMDCRSRVVRFCFPTEEKLVCEGYSSSHPNFLISNVKANKMISKGLLCHLVRVNDSDHDIISIDSFLVVNEFQDVFHDYLPPPREIEFRIDLEPDTKPTSIPPNRMTLAGLKELKLQLKDLTDKGFI
ncbi:uncharacterized protein [Solanum lycopersicum]|uniref:uncharacterized protein n=1 Tax=Solanum lycopersicum TaxID=4081 RepID=UPI003749FDB9